MITPRATRMTWQVIDSRWIWGREAGVSRAVAGGRLPGVGLGVDEPNMSAIFGLVISAVG